MASGSSAGVARSFGPWRSERALSFSCPFDTTADTSLQLVNEGCELVIHAGDISYARGIAYLWDQWHQIVEPYATKVPYMVGIGNHEYDHLELGQGKDPSGAAGVGFHPEWGNYGDDSHGECGVPTYNRFTMPGNGNALFWYSFDYGSVHFIMLSTEHNITEGSKASTANGRRGSSFKATARCTIQRTTRGTLKCPWASAGCTKTCC